MVCSQFFLVRALDFKSCEQMMKPSWLAVPIFFNALAFLCWSLALHRYSNQYSNVAFALLTDLAFAFHCISLVTLVYLNRIRILKSEAQQSLDTIVALLDVLMYTIIIILIWTGYFSTYPTISPVHNTNENISLWRYYEIVITCAIMVMSVYYNRRHGSTKTAEDIAVDLNTIFIRFVSHELRSHLSHLTMGLQMVEDELRPESQTQKLLSELQDSCDSAVQILSDILMVKNFKHDDGGRSANSSLVRLDDMIDEIIEGEEAKAIEKHCRFTADIDLGITDLASLPHHNHNDDSSADLLDTLRVLVQRADVKHSIKYLLRQAMKATLPGSVVTLRSRLQVLTDTNHRGSAMLGKESGRPSCLSSWGCRSSYDRSAAAVIRAHDTNFGAVLIQKIGFVVIEVVDSGYGMTQEDVNAIFQQTEQSLKSSTSFHSLVGGQGSGLGLSILKDILAKNDSKVTAFSEGRQKGTTFKVHIPLYAILPPSRVVNEWGSTFPSSLLRHWRLFGWIKPNKVHIENRNSAVSPELLPIRSRVDPFPARRNSIHPDEPSSPLDAFIDAPVCIPVGSVHADAELAPTIHDLGQCHDVAAPTTHGLIQAVENDLVLSDQSRSSAVTSGGRGSHRLGSHSHRRNISDAAVSVVSPASSIRSPSSSQTGMQAVHYTHALAWQASKRALRDVQLSPPEDVMYDSLSLKSMVDDLSLRSQFHHMCIFSYNAAVNKLICAFSQDAIASTLSTDVDCALAALRCLAKGSVQLTAYGDPSTQPAVVEGDGDHSQSTNRDDHAHVEHTCIFVPVFSLAGRPIGVLGAVHKQHTQLFSEKEEHYLLLVGSNIRMTVEETPANFVDSHSTPSITVGLRQVGQTTLTCLVVDDVKMHRRSLRKLLEALGPFKVDEAADGCEALRKVFRQEKTVGQSYDIVFLDCLMPVMDGPTAAKKMLAAGFTGVIVGYSGMLSMAVSAFTASGVTKVLEKPFLRADMIKIIEGLSKATQSLRISMSPVSGSDVSSDDGASLFSDPDRSREKDRAAVFEVALPVISARMSRQVLCGASVVSEHLDEDEPDELLHEWPHTIPRSELASCISGAGAVTCLQDRTVSNVDDSLHVPSHIVVETETEAEAAKSKVALPNNNEHFHFLVVDDMSSNRKIVSRFLLKFGHSVVEAIDGIDALQKYEQSLRAVEEGSDTGWHFDCILMDFVMPHMDGPTAATRLRELGYSAPIIGLTGNALQFDIDHFLASGVDRVIIKPLRNESFEEVVQEIIASKQGAGALRKDIQVRLVECAQ